MALTIDTSLIPGKTIITDSNGGIAVISNAPEDSTSPGYTISNEIADKLDIIANHLQSLVSKITEIETHQQIKATKITEIETHLHSLETDINDIETHQRAMKERAEGEGIHIKGPYEWLSMAAIYRIFIEQGVDFNSIKQQVESLPKQDGFP